MALKLDRCPSCGSERIKRVQRKWTGRVNGEAYSVPALEFYECPDCGERVYDREAMRRIQAASPAFSANAAASGRLDDVTRPATARSPRASKRSPNPLRSIPRPA
jgi:YgiT-type zinc finger domain-containing protein